ncbi:MAG: phenylalanine--tRNA ligase subunit beta [Candidatus Velthaea sp.]
MLVPLGWLRDYIDLPDDTDLIVARLALLGFPVESVETRPVISGVIVGKIAKLEKHPNADRLQVCTIDIGSEKMLTIATAATNVAQDQIVPVATIGAQLPHLKIEPRKMRGIDSEGMLCSAEELALEPDWFEDGIMQLDQGIKLGTDVVKLFRLDQPVLDIEVTANRVDALSLIGIARELGAAFGTELRIPDNTLTYGGVVIGDDGKLVESAWDSSDVRVTLESLDCRRYVAQRVSTLRVRPAKSWMRVRLALAGQRPINNLVDISNFVMLELGQPLHFFDFEKIAGRHIIVRDATPGEKLTTLDGVERELDPTALLIADEAQPTGLAGLMGGAVSEVSESTREIVIESANFSGPRVRRMSVKLGLRSEASTRNEKNLAISMTDVAASRAARLLEQEGGVIHMPRGFGKTAGLPTVIALAKTEVERLLGFDVKDGELVRALASLGFEVQPTLTPDLAKLVGVSEAELRNIESFEVTVPYWRSDIAIPADIVEEIARIVGYDRVSAEIPAIADQPLASDAFDREMAIADRLAGLGYHECMTLALQPLAVAERWRAAGIDVPKLVEITNPLSEDQRWMRFSLLPALLAHAQRERAVRPLYTFEIGHVFADDAAAPRETNVVTLLATTKRSSEQPAWRDTAFLAAKSDVLALVRAITGIDATVERATAPGLHPGKTAQITIAESNAGFVGAVDPRLLRAYGIEDDAVAAVIYIDALPPSVVRSYVPLSKYPPVERDLALIVDPAAAAGAIVAAVRAERLVRKVDVFDEYRGPQIGAGKKSLALRVSLQRDDATLTDADADAAITAIVATLTQRFGATLRA